MELSDALNKAQWVISLLIFLYRTLFIFTDLRPVNSFVVDLIRIPKLKNIFQIG